MIEVKEEAIRQFRQRLKSRPEQVENASLHAGEPMYFYCEHCGVQTDLLNEEYIFPPRQCCSQCQGIISMGFLEEAKRETQS